MNDVFQSLLQKYGQAWEQQDTGLILSIFTPDASYHDPFYNEPAYGIEGIRDYWDTKVCRDQSDIQFKLLNTWIDGSSAIAEWEAEFNDLIKGTRTYIKEVAIFEIENGKFKSLREYYKSKTLRDL